MFMILKSVDDFLRSLVERFRIMNLKLRGARLKEGVRVYGKIIYVGNLKHLSVGSHSTLNHGVFLNLRHEICIGNRVHLSPYAQIHTGSLVLEELPRQHRAAPVIIEDDVWVASGAVICPGVRIGQGSVIGANAVITQDVPLYTLALPAETHETRRLAVRSERS